MRRRSKRRHSPRGGGGGGGGVGEEEEEEVKAKVFRPLRRSSSQGEEPEEETPPLPPPSSSTRRRYHHHKTYASRDPTHKTCDPEETHSPNHKTSDPEETAPPGGAIRRNHHHKTYERRAPLSRRLEPRQHGGAAVPGGGGEGRAGSTAAEAEPRKTTNGRENGFPDGVSNSTTSTSNGDVFRIPDGVTSTTATNGDVSKHSQPPPVNASQPPNSSVQPRSSHARTRRSSSRSRSTSSRGHGRKSGSCEDDDEGHMVYDTGLVLRERFEVVSSLGEGAFAKVVRCTDRHNGRDVALKIIKNIDRYREAARSEVEILEEIRRLDDDDRFACVKMLEWFEHHGHVVIVFELLGLSTFDFLKHNDFLPFSVEQIRHMAFQVVKAVCFLHRNKMTHTDLKPENILFVCSDYQLEHNDKMKRDERTLRTLDVKVVDFGNAIFDHEHHTSVVSTRHYRAPEVILDLGWNQACDVWSMGCILMEFYLGLMMFQTHDSKEHLAMMERILGPIPPHLLNKTKKQHYVHAERLDWDENSSKGRYVRKNCKPLKHYMQSKAMEHEQLFDLIRSMMEYDVNRRITMEEALWHPFFTPLRKTRT